MRTRPVHHAAAALAAIALVTASGVALAGTVAEAELDGSAANNSLATAQSLDGNFTSGDNPNAVGNSGNVPGLGGGWATSSVDGAVGDSFFSNPGNNISQDVDFYSFTIGGTRTVFLDIDSGGGSDMTLWLFDSTGTLLFYDDQSGFAGESSDAGSTNDDDPFIGEIELGTGTYYAAVSAFSNPALVYVRYYDLYFGYRTSTADPAITGYAYRSGVYGTDGDGYGTFSYPTGFQPGAMGESGFLYNGVQPAGAAVDGAYTLHVTVNPEPSTLALFGLGGLGLLGLVRRRRRKNA